MIWDSGGGVGAAIVCFFVIGDFFAVVENAPTQVNILIVKFTHDTSIFIYCSINSFESVNF